MKPILQSTLLVALSALTLSSPAHSDLLIVPDDSITIQGAILAAQPGDTVAVRGDGRMYGENLIMRAGVSVVGIGDERPLIMAVVGGQPTVDFPDANTGRDTLLSRVTLINGTSDRGAGIRISAGASPSITRNVISYQESQYGAGIFAYPNSNPLIEKNSIRDCIATGGGGGIFLLVPGPQTRVSKNDIQYCSAGSYGGGLVTFGGAVEASSNRLEDNSAGGHAGGFLAYLTELVATKNVFERNQAGGRGGGAYLLAVDEPTFQGGAFRHNSADEGGGLYIRSGDVEIGSVELTDNLALQRGGGVFASSGSGVVSLSACDLRRNAAGLDWTAGEGGGVFCDDAAKLEVVNCVLHQNSASYSWNSGAGIRVRSAGTVLAVNNTLVENRLNGFPIPRSGLSIGDVDEARVTNNWFVDHDVHVLRDLVATPVILRTNLYNSNSLGQLVLDPSDGIAVPQFVNPGVDFHVLFFDPGVGQGSLWQPGVPTVDMDGQPRQLPSIDIGADEFHPW